MKCSDVEIFVLNYCNESGISEAEFFNYFVPMPDSHSPSGISVISNNPLSIKSHIKLYWPKELNIGGTKK
jgi:hypothetical protein